MANDTRQKDAVADAARFTQRIDAVHEIAEASHERIQEAHAQAEQAHKAATASRQRAQEVRRRAEKAHAEAAARGRMADEGR
jgi:uncharacterized coiled-coil DUF342 family protein